MGRKSVHSPLVLTGASESLRSHLKSNPPLHFIHVHSNLSILAERHVGGAANSMHSSIARNSSLRKCNNLALKSAWQEIDSVDYPCPAVSPAGVTGSPAMSETQSDLPVTSSMRGRKLSLLGRTLLCIIYILYFCLNFPLNVMSDNQQMYADVCRIFFNEEICFPIIASIARNY